MRLAKLAPLSMALGLLVLLITAAVAIVAGPALTRSAINSRLHITNEMYAQAAAEQGDTAGLRKLLDTDPALVACRDSEGWTLLHEAARGGYVEAVKLLLAKGADTNATNDEGNTPLQCAAAAGEKEAARMLAARAVG